MIVNMPVEAMSEKCLTCPELDIDIYTKEYYDLAKVDDTDTVVKTVKYENQLSCRHCNRCRVIFDHADGLKEETKPAPKKATRKTPAKTTAKKSTKTK